MKTPKLAAPPSVKPKTWAGLLAATADFDALAPWEYMYDTHLLGLVDPVTKETRIGAVLGNAREVYAAVFYRRAGLRWILSTLDESFDEGDLNFAEGMDCLKVEFVPKRELSKEDLRVLRATSFKPPGRGAVWPQFRAAEPGWHPWYLNESDAQQLLTDLPRLTAFCRLLKPNPDLFSDRPLGELPFVPEHLPDRPLTPNDLDWRPVIPPPVTGYEPFEMAAEDMKELHRLPRSSGSVCEFDCSILPGGSVMENGRPCFGRYCLLVEQKYGMVLGATVQSGVLPPGEACVLGLFESLRSAGHLPEKIFISRPQIYSALQPFCMALMIELVRAHSLPALETAFDSLSALMASSSQ